MKKFLTILIITMMTSSAVAKPMTRPMPRPAHPSAPKTTTSKTAAPKTTTSKTAAPKTTTSKTAVAPKETTTKKSIVSDTLSKMKKTISKEKKSIASVPNVAPKSITIGRSYLSDYLFWKLLTRRTYTAPHGYDENSKIFILNGIEYSSKDINEIFGLDYPFKKTYAIVMNNEKIKGVKFEIKCQM